MTLQQIIDHLAACVADMNASSDHDLAFKAQAAILAVDAVQSACAELGFLDNTGEAGDWPIPSQPETEGEPK